MRKWVILSLVLALLIPSVVYAQQPVTLDSLDVQLWPEYDKPDMLVICNAAVSSGVKLPAEVTLRIPEDGKLHVVAVGDSIQGVSDVGVDYSVESGGGRKLVRITLGEGQRWIRLEYYAPITRDGNLRHFVYGWDGEYAVSAFSISLKETVGSTTLKTTPAMLPAGLSDDGYPQHGLNVGPLAAGATFTLGVDYQKDDNLLSISGQPVEPIDGTASKFDPIPWFVAGVLLVVVLALLGALYVTQIRRPAKARARHSPRHAEDEPATGDLIYCHQCGNRAKPGDRFCRTCGTRLRTGASS
jgi:hypothetical protein